jgi:RNA polymerase sigma factor (sigma-70 family)
MTPQALLAPARLARKPILATQSDERLVDLVRAGYEPAFEAIVARYRGQLVGYCRRFLPEARAEDVVQQTFVNAYGAMKDGQGELRLRAWLHRIAHNAALNALRDRGLRHEQLHERLDGVERPDQVLERKQGLRDMLAAIQALPARQRDALVLRELEGRSYEQIASKLGVSGGAVRQLLNRARTRLREGATALTPVGLVVRMPWSESGESVAGRIAEVCGASAGVVAAKVCATALVTGAVIGGVAALPDDHGAGHKPSGAVASDVTDGTGGSMSPGDVGATSRRNNDGGGSGSVSDLDRSGGGDDGDDRSGTSGDNSGPGGGGDDHSGSGDSGSDSSGSGSSGFGTSGYGTSGSGTSGSGTSGSGTSGSGTSGSGTSGSGTSGSGDSGTSGSGISGSSGSGDTTTSFSDSGSGSSGSSGSGETLTTESSSDGH